MGFRDMYLFNIALLGKQGWRLIHNNDSLVHGVIKSKYYRNENFLQSHLGKNPSLIWRGIWEAKTMLQQGFRWRVGNGKSIKIWKDRWIPFTSTLQPQTPIGDWDEEGLVCDLIESSTKKWRLELLYEMFASNEGAKISMMQISRIGDNDTIIWHPDNKGAYSVKSGYRWLFNRHCTRQMEDSSRHCGLWNKIWEIEVPKKVQIFVWRMLRNILPVKVSLAKKHITADLRCPRCSQGDETVLHAIRLCPEARVVWEQLNFNWDGNIDETEEWFFNVMAKAELVELQQLAVTAWTIWNGRNRVFFRRTEEKC